MQGDDKFFERMAVLGDTIQAEAIEVHRQVNDDLEKADAQIGGAGPTPLKRSYIKTAYI